MNLPMEDMRAANSPKFTLPLFEDIKKVFKNEDRPRLHLSRRRALAPGKRR